MARGGRANALRVARLLDPVVGLGRKQVADADEREHA